MKQENNNNNTNQQTDSHKSNCVVFKGRKNGITIMLDPEARFGVLESALREKAEEAAFFFKDAKTAITFAGRALTEREEERLLHILSQATDLSITFVTSEDEGQDRTILAEKPPDEPDPSQSLMSLISADENMTVFHRGSLRSGQSIRFAGSVVVIGDINPGAEIIAEGNVVVLGSVKGLVHAGCSGNADCFVTALSLQPTQLRISDIITYIPREISKKHKSVPSYAYVEQDHIYVVPLA